MPNFLNHTLEVAMLVLSVWLTWRVPRKEKFRPGVPSRFIGTYEIPNPYKGEMIVYALLIIGPSVCLIATHHLVAAMWAFALFTLLFHVRNVAVRAENSGGLHDPRWGRHLWRQRQKQWDASLPSWLSWLPKLRTMMFGE